MTTGLNALLAVTSMNAVPAALFVLRTAFAAILQVVIGACATKGSLVTAKHAGI